MKNTYRAALSLSLLALPVLSYATEAVELEKLQQEIKSLRSENQQLRQDSTASQNMSNGILQAEPAEAEKPAWKPNWMKDFKVSIGTKVWINKWEGFHKSPGTDLESFQLDNEQGGKDTYSITSDIDNSEIKTSADEQVTPIPTLNMRYKQFFASGSYYPETEFTFAPITESTSWRNSSSTNKNNEQIDVLDAAKGSGNVTTYANAKRTEWDINVGYSLTPNIALLAGYKSVRQVFNQSYIYDNDLADKRNGNAEEEIYDIGGPLLGIALSAPLTHGFGAYFNYMHGFLDGSYLNKTYNVDYDLMEGGLAYTFNGEMIPAGVPMSSATLFAGYRAQMMDISDFKGATDITQGFTTGVNLSF